MHGKAADCEGWVHGAELVDVEDHGEKNRGGESSVHYETRQVIAHGYARRGSARNKSISVLAINN